MQYYANPHPKKRRNTHIGPSYPEIRLWIQRELDIHVEAIDRRCRELFDSGEMRREEDVKGRVHVYPTENDKP